MTDPALAQTIREVLAEELGKLRAARAGRGAGADGPEIEWVALRDDAALGDFVRRVLAMAADPAARAALESGRRVFRLKPGPGSDAPAAAAAGAAPETCIAQGVLSERMVDRLPAGTTRLAVGKAVRVTPLAKDRLRHRGITLERKDR